MNKSVSRHLSIVFCAMLALSCGIFAQEKMIVTAENAAANASKVGDTLPEFSLKDSSGQTVTSKQLLKGGNVVLVFYRGSWCPFCNTYLRKLQSRVADIKAAGGTLVAVSAENPDASLAIAKKNELNYTVLSDPNLDLARKLGIVYQLPDKTDEKYRSMGLDVAKHNAMKLPELPLAVTYIVNKKGKITYAFIETDYKKRAEPDAIITELKKIAKP